MRCKSQNFLLLIFLLCNAVEVLLGAEPKNAILISLMEKDLNVSFIDPSRDLRLAPNQKGIVIWASKGGDDWTFVASGDRWTKPASGGDGSKVGYANLFARSRAIDGGGAGESSGVRMTMALDQLLSASVFRGKSGFITPHSGRILNPKLTIRREPTTDNGLYQPAVASLNRGNREIAVIDWTEGQSVVRFEEIPKLVEMFPEGLPPGEYTLRLRDSSDSVVFTVEDAKWTSFVNEVPNRFAELLASRDHPLYVQIAVETVLDIQDENGKPSPYLTDALDLLEGIPDDLRTTYLQRLRSNILNSLSKKESQTAEHKLISTGIPQIDRARACISKGDWSAASAILDEQMPADSRAIALAKLHRAIIFAQSGSGLSSSAEVLFKQSLRELQGEREADLYLANINAGNFLLARSTDQLYNHAFQMASGVDNPVMTTLADWVYARHMLQNAVKSAEELDVNEQAAAKVSLARLYVLLADIVRTLDGVESDGTRQFVSGEEEAARVAKELVGEVVALGHDINPSLRAAAAEILAHLAYRARDAACEEYAKIALEAYLNDGSLAGVEGVERMLAMFLQHANEFALDSTVVEASNDKALTHYLISMELADFLESRIPQDEYGLAHAGFFSRRTYINEQVIDTLVAQGKAQQALYYAEKAKAGSLRELLSTAPRLDDSASMGKAIEGPAELTTLLADWPKDTAAVEYFLGNRQAWIFVVRPTGEVSAREMFTDSATSPVFIAKIRAFLTSMEGQAVRMRNRLASGEGFDDRWQDDLSEFREILLPESALASLRSAKNVVIVPHHILHYFPFAALVTELDSSPRTKMQMARPRFLIDEPFSIVHAPSLLVWDRLRRAEEATFSQVNAVGIVDFPGAPRLPGVALDIQNLRKAFGQNVEQVLFAEQANESNAIKLLDQPGMLLFATHGHNEAERPLDSYLLCLKDRSSDGRLTAAELFRAQINAPLVVMSACYTGLADQSPLPGDDLFGIQRALLQSGSLTVVSGLWDVYDGTGPELMDRFFANLAQGIPSANALSNAQRAFLEKQRATNRNPWVHPYFWSVYTAAGSGETYFRPSATAVPAR